MAAFSRTFIFAIIGSFLHADWIIFLDLARGMISEEES